jgi:hypothetical protein
MTEALSEGSNTTVRLLQQAMHTPRTLLKYHSQCKKSPYVVGQWASVATCS